jgi:serine/threonine protein kinase
MQQSPPGGARYEAIAMIARGGMATVHLGLDHAESPPRRVALKRLHAVYASMPEMIELLAEEARIVSALDHPNVVSLFDCVRDEKGMTTLVMEWVEGVDLGRYLDRVEAPIRPWDEAVYVARSIFSALAAVHEHRTLRDRAAPVFHRDVTPGNVLVGIDGTVKLTDFGLARAMDRHTVTTPGVLKGRIAYLAPELIAGQRADARTDMFAAGIVLWEMLAGRRLYDAGNELALFVAAGRAEIPPLAPIREDLPPALVDAVDRMTRRNPSERFETAREAADALGDVLARSTFEPSTLGDRVGAVRGSSEEA